ncbi:MAG: tRNA lysidine(34) synthetase TilS [Rhabdochlamydiaceae bacterium]
MSHHIFQAVDKFLALSNAYGAKLVLGFSGGMDSTALLHALIKWQKKYRFDLHLAHLDHGWRKNSAQEACALKALAKQMGLPYHQKNLTGCPETNVEEFFRNKRYEFLRTVYDKIAAKALILGHHGDDQAETCLKRILEGASLFSIGSMQKVVHNQGMEIWRPLIDISKREIESYIKNEKLSYIDDHTNYDETYLRARMRGTILPFLENSFGKNVSKPLCDLASLFQKLDDYFSDKLEPFLSLVETVDNRETMDLKLLSFLKPFEIELFIQKWFSSRRLYVSKVVLRDIIESISKENLNKKFLTGSHKIVVHEKRISIEFNQEKNKEEDI